MPVSCAFIMMRPLTSFLSTVPLLLTSRLTLSSTSMKTSFFLCTMPSRRQSRAPVMVLVICLSAAALVAARSEPRLMYILSTSSAQFCG